MNRSGGQYPNKNNNSQDDEMNKKPAAKTNSRASPSGPEWR